MDQHSLTTTDIATITGVNPATARRWCKRPGPGYIPMPDDAWKTLVEGAGKIKK